MATTSDRIPLRSPDALVAALPYLLGFHPEESVVLVWLAHGRVRLTQRLDLPGPGADLDAWFAAAFDHPGARAADEVIIAIATAADSDDVLAASMLREADSCGVPVRDLLYLHRGRWRSLLCTDRACCPPDGRAVPQATRDAVAAEFAVVGRAPASDRQEIAASFETDGPAAAEVSAELVALGSPPDLESWRDARIAGLVRQLSSGGCTVTGPEDAAWALEGLADVRVRDTVLWDLAQLPPEQVAGALSVLIGLVRIAPSGHVAPAASVTAVAAWLLGDGVRAHLALERAHDDDPGYSLAALLSASLDAGLPPEAWRESLAGLSRADCRFGSGDIGPPRYGRRAG